LKDDRISVVIFLSGTILDFVRTFLTAFDNV